MIKNIDPHDLHTAREYEVSNIIRSRSVAQFAYLEDCRVWYIGRAAIRKPKKIDLEDQRGEFRVLRHECAPKVSVSHIEYFRSCIS